MAEIEEMHQTGAKLAFHELFRPPIIKPMIISLMCMLFQQFTGFNAIYYYCTYIFNQAGFNNSLTVSFILTYDKI